jgi:UDP-N-acetylglucosamine 2-epimerase (non-hydrolysing)
MSRLPVKDTRMKVISVVGARPNFMKVAPVHEAIRALGISAQLIHTGQHYDEAMSQVFFDELGMPKPDRNLQVGSASHAVQTARIMEAFETVVIEEKPDLVLVAGDVNSTIACTLVAVKLGIKTAHLEAGLRSFDREMPEEINRVLTDQICDLLLTPSKDGNEHLIAEGIPENRIVMVGNAMIDTLLTHTEKANSRKTYAQYGVPENGYGLVTLHRPSNVDSPDVLKRVLETLVSLSKDLPILFPVHPRTRKQISAFGFDSIVENKTGMHLFSPVGYLDFLSLQSQARMVLTDSGGIQEETTALGIPCLTLRENTERPITIDCGTNTLVGTDPELIRREFDTIMKTGGKAGRVPELWDGHTGERAARAIQECLLRNP